MRLEPEEIKALITRLKRANGHLASVIRMLEEGSECEDALTQLAAVNKAVGGVDSSAHTQGWAVDFVCPDFGPPFEVCRKIVTSDLLFDQLIHEYGRWTHLSFAPTMRRQPLSIASAAQGYVKGIVSIAVR